MRKQLLINKYFHKLCSDKFFEYDDEVMTGMVKDVIEELKNQIEYLKGPKNDYDEEYTEYLINETKDLINEINNTYSHKNDVIKLTVHPMSGSYVIQDKNQLYEELKDYYEELKEEQNGN